MAVLSDALINHSVESDQRERAAALAVTMAFQVNSDLALADLRELATFGACGQGVERRMWTPADVQSRRWLQRKMAEAGLEAHIDAVGNVVGRTNHKRRVVIGSHTDTVPKGGWLDGALGVITGLAIARALQTQKPDLPIGVEVVSFADEEGYFAPFLGSKVAAGFITVKAALTTKNSLGETLAACIQGSELATQNAWRIDPSHHVAFLELHIEQGPVLDAHQIALGVVTHIVGIRQDRVTFVGSANHAGTTPMNMRADAAAALFDFATEWRRQCAAMGSPTAVWNVGHAILEPNAHNVVASRALGTCQYRDIEEETLQRCGLLLRESAEAAARRNQCSWSIERQLEIQPTPMSPGLVDICERACRTLGHSFRRMPSGAGHDAMIIGRVIPAGMLFVPSKGGISHSTDEDTPAESLARGMQALASAFEQVSRLQ